ncbi:disease resistance protein PIK6-NP-like [Triticum dicoccoides]|uniref:disease resistance protein PIK6-NP-like n=1 Tax=Triticum dicoccoides TaxID=85692 RepID=UPI000E7AC71F|nr:disease resistance protein PIK6-NP-like [Triticum dicoccoides]
MADLVVGLAKSVVEGALTKAQAAIEEEAKLRQSAQRDLAFITDEFEMMHSFLKVANPERVENKVVMTWVRQVRELAYDVEDCIEFVIHLNTKTMWWWRLVPLWCMAPPMRALALDEAVGQIEHLKARVEDVSRRNVRYNLISDTGSKPVVVQQQESLLGAAVAATKVNMLAEARGATKRKQRFGDLTGLITRNDNEHSNDLQVISVWGSGSDHGTTAIIRKTYYHQGLSNNFTYRAWVKLMHPFSPQEFVKGLMSQFYANSCEEEYTNIGMHVLARMEVTQEALFLEFKRLVAGRYLIVLEGLSNMVDWDVIRTFLPDMKNGSWIIVSTQQSEIATLCIGHSYKMLELRKFSDEHSVCALFKASQGDGDKNNKSLGTHGDKRKGKEPKVDEDEEETQTRDEKIKLLKEEAIEWKKKNDPLVGRESTVIELAQYPARARVNSPPVMAVWGIAGVGKTALVKKLFYDTVLWGRNYEDYYWVDVSHPFNMRDMYLTLLSDFHSDKDPTEECHRLLEGHCFVVIDDLRSTKEWDLIQPALVSKGSKSIIIVITTEESIAKHCTNNEGLVFNVKALEAAAASNLFMNKVLKNNSSYSLNVQDMNVQQLVRKCGGIPKVIAAIAGSFLAMKNEKNMGTVSTLNSRFMHHLETGPEYDSLQDLFGWMHSYFRTCPDSLKPCIFYLSIFPRDQIIRRRRLVRRWIAEGYSRDNHNESAEENGEKHFSELLELSIIQQLSSRSPSSVISTAFNLGTVSMVLCQVNAFIREYIVSQRMEENLVFELGEQCALTTQRTGRHLVILKNWDRDRIVFKSIDFSRLRSLTVFGEWESFFVSGNMKMLRVLDLEDAVGLNDADLEKIVECLHRLKFLSLRGHSEIHHLPNSLGHMRQLQTLDVRGTSIVTLPESIIKLHNLQYIRAGTTSVPHLSSRWCCGHHLVGVQVPSRIGKLTALHTLGVVNIGVSGIKTMVKELKKLTQLRKIGVSGINRKNNKVFDISVHTHLESLSLQLDKDNQDGLDDITLPWKNLWSLKMYGLQDRLPKWKENFTKLNKLNLEMATLGKSDIEFLAKLPELCILCLCVKQLLDGKLHFYAELFEEELPTYKKVKILEIACSSSKLHVTFGSKSMQNLELLKVNCSSALYHLTGLNGLPKLKEVLLTGTTDQTIKTDFERQLVSHPKKPAVKLEELTRLS